MSRGPPARRLPPHIWRSVEQYDPPLTQAEATAHMNMLLRRDGEPEISVRSYQRAVQRRRQQQREAAENAVTLPLAADDTVEENGASTTDTNLARLDDAAESVGDASGGLDAAAQTAVAASPTSPSASRAAEFHEPMPESHSPVGFDGDDGASHAGDGDDDARAQPNDAAQLAGTHLRDSPFLAARSVAWSVWMCAHVCVVCACVCVCVCVCVNMCV